MHGDGAAGADVVYGQKPQQFRFPVVNTQHGALPGGSEIFEQDERGHRYSAGGVRDGVSVRIMTGMTQTFIDRLEKAVGDGMLKELGFIMNLVPGVTEIPDKPGLDKPMPPHDSNRAGGPFLCELQRPVRNMINKPKSSKLLHHAGYRRRSNRQLRRQHRRGDGLVLPLRVLINGLEVVLDRRVGQGSLPLCRHEQVPCRELSVGYRWDFGWLSDAR